MQRFRLTNSFLGVIFFAVSVLAACGTESDAVGEDSDDAEATDYLVGVDEDDAASAVGVIAPCFDGFNCTYTLELDHESRYNAQLFTVDVFLEETGGATVAILGLTSGTTERIAVLDASQASRLCIVGTSDRDIIMVQSAYNRCNRLPLPPSVAIRGRGGNDHLHGDCGGDRLCGGSGDDRILGNGGDDLLRGGKGDDTITGGGGTDTIKCGGGNDTARMASYVNYDTYENCETMVYDQ